MSEKLRYDLIPARPLELMAEAFTVGGKKHGEYDWQEKTPEVYEAKIFRHFQAIRQGEYVCPEDGISHFGALMADAAIMYELIMAKETLDCTIAPPHPITQDDIERASRALGEVFFCPTCPKSFDTEKQLTEHTNEAHPNEPDTMG